MMNAQTAHGMVQASISYDLAIERARAEAQPLSTDYLRGYLDHYESGRGTVRRVIERVFNAFDITFESPKITGFKRVLEERLNSK
jgi:hypothetical protein